MNRTSSVRMLVPVLLSLLSVACSGDKPPAADQDAGDGSSHSRGSAPTTDASGEPLTDLQAYMVLYGRSPDDLKYWKRIEDRSKTSIVVTGLGKGVWYFSVVATVQQGGGRVSRRRWFRKTFSEASLTPARGCAFL